MGMGNKRKISKFISLVLRHRPDLIGIELDGSGWVAITELVTKAKHAGVCLSEPEPLVRCIVDESDKQRFRISEDGLRIRANHGHSLPAVDLGLTPTAPPKVLFHGTARHLLNSIAAQGIVPGKRRMVHLSESYEAAMENGKRHGLPEVITVSASKMHGEGFLFYRSVSGVWLTERVLIDYVVRDVR